MSLFRRLRDIINPPKEERPYGLTEGEVQKLRELEGSGAWKVYQKVLDLRINFYGEGMLSSVSTEKMWEMRGYIMGIRAAGLIVDEILQKEKELSEHAERRRSTSIRANDHRVTALLNTPSWT